MENKPKSFKPPANWDALKYCAPYYIYYPEPDKLQIRVKPRYWFSMTLLVLFVVWLVFLALPRDTFHAILDAIIPSKRNDIAGLWPVFFIPVALVAGICVLIYKRTGLVEISAEGITFVENPRTSPQSYWTIPLYDIMGFDDQDMYTRGAVTGTKLMVYRHENTAVELLKIWGRDSLSRHDYFELRQAAEGCFNQLKKKYNPKKPDAAFFEAKTAQRERENTLARPRQYRVWEAIALSLTLVFSGGLLYFLFFFPNEFIGQFKWVMLALISVILLNNAAWIVRLKGDGLAKRAIFLTVFTIALPAITFPLSSHLRRNALLNTHTVRGEILGSEPSGFSGKGDFEHRFTYYFGKSYFGAFRGPKPLKTSKPVFVRINNDWPSIYEVDAAKTIEAQEEKAGSRKKEKKRRK